MIGKIADFESMGLVDGPGVRFVVFMQGCPLRCVYCHNPEMWDLSKAKYQMTPSELLNKVKKYKPYFKENGGITISGGEPLMQAEFVKEVFKLAKSEGINTCLDTSGFGVGYQELLDFCDLVILDVKSLDDKEYQLLTGQSISKFYKFLETCQKKGIPLWLRQVVVPNINDNPSNILKLKDFARKLKNVEKIELLPYHSMAKKKYHQLGIDYKLNDTPDMDKKKCNELEKLLK